MPSSEPCITSRTDQAVQRVGRDEPARTPAVTAPK